MTVGPTVDIPIRVNIEEENFDSVKKVARVLSRIGTDDPPSESEADEALREFLDITTVNGTPVSDHLRNYAQNTTP